MWAKSEMFYWACVGKHGVSVRFLITISTTGNWRRLPGQGKLAKTLGLINDLFGVNGKLITKWWPILAIVTQLGFTHRLMFLFQRGNVWTVKCRCFSLAFVGATLFTKVCAFPTRQLCCRSVHTIVHIYWFNWIMYVCMYVCMYSLFVQNTCTMKKIHHCVSGTNNKK